MNWRIKSIEAILATSERRPLRRSLGAMHLTLMGIGSVIGSGIFVLTATAAQKAGPAMILSFIIAGIVCAATALCYAELAAMVPAAGSAYTYVYAVFGEVLAWTVGWALIVEYSVAAAAVSVGWSGYLVALLQHSFGVSLPKSLSAGYFAGGVINLPAALLALSVSALLVVGNRASARVNAICVAIKISALTMFMVLALPAVRAENFLPFAPTGFSGVGGAAASIFFAYVGFDAISTTAEETRNPQRNVPIGIIATITVCTVFFVAVAIAVIGAGGAQPVLDLISGHALATGSAEFAAACSATPVGQTLACSTDPLAHVLRGLNWPTAARLVGLAAFVALPSVLLMMFFGQTRVFFAMARDGLLPPVLSKVHERFKTPYVVTLFAGIVVTIGAALFPIGQLADLSNAGTLFAFVAVVLGVMFLRRDKPERARVFRTPGLWVIGPVAVAGCSYLFFSLSLFTQCAFAMWSLVGLAVYMSYGRKHSLLASAEERSRAPLVTSVTD